MGSWAVEPVGEQRCVGSEAPVALPRWLVCEQFVSSMERVFANLLITASEKVAGSRTLTVTALCFSSKCGGNLPTHRRASIRDPSSCWFWGQQHLKFIIRRGATSLPEWINLFIAEQTDWPKPLQTARNRKKDKPGPWFEPMILSKTWNQRSQLTAVF